MSQTHHAQALALYTSQEVQAPAVRYGLDLGVGSHSWLAWALWQLGAPTQALRHSQAARTLAQEGSHAVSLILRCLGSFRASVSPRSSSGARPSNGRDHAGDGAGV